MPNEVPVADKIGDQVLYVLPGSHAVRPAVVVAVHRPGYVNLQVFTDGGNDGEPNNVRWVTSVEFDASKKDNTYHRG
jgi:hypothetical protein